MVSYIDPIRLSTPFYVAGSNDPKGVEKVKDGYFKTEADALDYYRLLKHRYKWMAQIGEYQSRTDGSVQDWMYYYWSLNPVAGSIPPPGSGCPENDWDGMYVFKPLMNK